MSTGGSLGDFGTVWITWIKTSWKFTVNDINSYLFAYTAVITKNLDQIKCSAKLEAKNNLGVYDIRDKKVALLDYIGMGAGDTYLAYNIHRLLAVSYHFNVVARLKFQFPIKLLVELIIYIQWHCVYFSTSVLLTTYKNTINFNVRKYLCQLNWFLDLD